MTSNQLRLTAQDVFLLSDETQVIVTLPSFDWNFAPGDVLLRFGEEELPFRQIGAGNHEGRPVALLSPLVTWSEVESFFKRLGRGQLSIVRRTTLNK